MVVAVRHNTLHLSAAKVMSGPFETSSGGHRK